MGKVKPENEWKFKCANTGKAIKRKTRYYRNGKYYANKNAWKAQVKKENEEKKNENEEKIEEKKINAFRDYFDYREEIKKIPPHRVLAINRGEDEKVLRVKVELSESFWRDAVMAVFRPNRQSPLAGQLELAIVDAAERLLLPAIERDVRRDLTEKSAVHAIRVFADNLRALLSQSPLSGINVLGIDPGFRTGVKVAAAIMPTPR